MFNHSVSLGYNQSIDIIEVRSHTPNLELFQHRTLDSKTRDRYLFPCPQASTKLGRHFSLGIMKCGCLDTFHAKPWAKSMREIKRISSVSDVKLIGRTIELHFDDGARAELTKLKDDVVRLTFDCPVKHFDVSKEESIISQSVLLELAEGKIVGNSIEFGGLTVTINRSPFSLLIKREDGKQIGFNTKNKTSVHENSFDVTFNDDSVLGLPARDSLIFLEPTIIGSDVLSDPYRIFNCDTGEFRPPKTFSVYGAINFLQASNSAIFVANASDTFVDLIKADNCLTSHFVSQCGPIDVFFFLGSRKETTLSFNRLTGPSFFPSLGDFGFNHCKWGLKTQEEVEKVIMTYESAGVPFDKIWLDIDHLVEQRPFTVNVERFPDFEKMKQDLRAAGRSLAIIQDPHLPFGKNHEQAEDCLKRGFAVKQANGETFVGWCWPGHSVYPDFLSLDVRKWWGDLVPTDVSLWNDMNEPSVFNDANENTMPMDNLHSGSLSHSCVHNVYGHFHSLASAQGVKSKTNVRPFVLTRSYFAGTHKHAAVWTGDAVSSHESLRVSIHQVCTASACGMSFIGADIGGFFGSPSQEFLEQWFANAVWIYPFLRMHCHIDSGERHGMVAGSAKIKQGLISRYELIPYWYTTFYLNHTQFDSVVRFLWFDYPEIERDNEQVLIGRNFMVQPVTSPDTMTFTIRCPMNTAWIDFYTFNEVHDHETVTYRGNIPVFVRMGTITPMFQNPSKCVLETRKHPLRLLVICNSGDCAEGLVYIDDGHTRSYLDGAFLLSQVRFDHGILCNTPIHAGYHDFANVSMVTVVRDGAPRDISVSLNMSLPWEHQI